LANLKSLARFIAKGTKITGKNLLAHLYRGSFCWRCLRGYFLGDISRLAKCESLSEFGASETQITGSNYPVQLFSKAVCQRYFRGYSTGDITFLSNIKSLSALDISGCGKITGKNISVQFFYGPVCWHYFRGCSAGDIIFLAKLKLLSALNISECKNITGKIFPAWLFADQSSDNASAIVPQVTYPSWSIARKFATLMLEDAEKSLVKAVPCTSFMGQSAHDFSVNALFLFCRDFHWWIYTSHQ